MEKNLKKLPKEILDLIYLARDIAAKNNMQVYLVGGFVRDMLLGVKNFDLDIVIEGDGIKFAEEFSAILKSKLIRHGRFGTATITYKPHLKIDIATARRESYPHPASLPVVSPGSLEDDLFRRDFTINAMAININGESFAKLIDLFKGKADLGFKKVRVLHDLSFIDDPTRILRAIRFEKRYNFNIEPRTLGLLKKAVKLGMLEEVQPQRVREELVLMLEEENPLKEIRRMQQLTGMSFINPHLSVLKNSYRLLASSQKQIRQFKKIYSHRRQPDAWLIYLMALIEHLGIKEIKAICRKFVFRKGEEKRIFSFKGIKRKYILQLSQKKTRAHQIFSILEPLSYEAIILLKAKYANPALQKYIEDFFEIYNGMRTLISGDDLCKLGVSPGPFYKDIFTKVLKAKLQGLVTTKEEELALIKKLVRPLR